MCEALKYAGVAAAGLAAAVVAVALLAAPASARPDGGSKPKPKPWDTDNLAYGSYSAENFRVPFH